MRKEFYEEPDYEVVVFESESVMLQPSGVTPVETDSDGWTIPIVKP